MNALAAELASAIRAGHKVQAELAARMHLETEKDRAHQLALVEKAGCAQQ